MTRVLVEQLHISFPLYHGASRSLRGTMTGAVSTWRSGPSARLARETHRRIVANVLEGLSFTLERGERLGLIGGNGAGKTTLLRALAGIYEPVSGHVRIEGQLGTLLDPSLGMNHDLTGRENIRLRCLYFGLDRAHTQRVIDNVTEFAGLAAFMDMPVKTYSAGMRVRLAFGVATAITPDVLLMDEWFMAGDASFMAKARERLESLFKRAEILIVSTHQPDVLLRWCTRVLWLENGRIRMQGPPAEVLDTYLGA
ncbi:ABC transporter ATP-binding protein [Acidomonas methanolica]|uniref:ABC transporter O-antigene exporter ATP-binding protein n=1 Tax=Acidomonas methanolica NBRC 104435 TaxID=1231351 RepID=A0A023D7L9_ACIMT|nr:ABC transporter ATP-binding protein [Acidomonas methanolica]MBU2655256.1 ABC transporter ATP-binding protein [Acidomonas methanolica]GAJ30158.1 ABC transporter O-antigene exporter ATP-binding protein [Acidomonas methanolica NBRC 104435]GBQ51822.1 O-antigen exporter ATP-binding protein [Acidomonas methanolica]GEK98697.1 sugar ABC transporter ATP-binding protein [Acidomonas methanolica NBRC 104435]